MLCIVITRKQLSVPIASLRKKKQAALEYDEVALEKFMQYYGFEERGELLKFLKTQCLQD
jgi:hypothetical protein